MKITSHIYQIGGSSESHQSDASIYLIQDGSEVALIDAGTGKGHEKVIYNIDKIGVNLKDIEYLFLTHCHYDHIGGAQEIRRVCGCRIVAHEKDAHFIENGDLIVTASAWYNSKFEPLSVDIKVTEEKYCFRIGSLDVIFHHTPGHSPGSSILTLKSDEMLVLFGQDVHGPLNEIIKSNREDYIKSLEFMLSLNADILCEGHFGIFIGKDRVKEFIESFL